MKLTEKHITNLLKKINKSGLAICRDSFAYFGPSYNRTYPFQSNLLKDRLVYVEYLEDDHYLKFYETREKEIKKLEKSFPFLDKILVRDSEGHCHEKVEFCLYVDGIRFDVESMIVDYGLRHCIGYDLKNFKLNCIKRTEHYTDEWEIKL